MSVFHPEKPIAIIGAGVMGTKVAWACARSGLRTRLFDDVEGKAGQSVLRACTWSEGDELARVQEYLSAASSLDHALQDVQLAFENVPERLALKQTVLADLSRRLGEEAFLGTNASAITSTPLARVTLRPERFFNLNFTDPRDSTLVELMTAADALPETVAFAMAWARAIAMVPLHVRREQLGYSFNRLWRVIKKEVLRQIAEGYTTAADIDRAWMMMFGTPMGPCGIMDDIGLHTIAAVERIYHEESGDPSDLPPDFLVDMVDAGRIGVGSGRGFYDYPDPAFQSARFLEGED